MKKYDVILADAPWTYDNAQMNDAARGGIQYPVMSMKELAALPIYKAAQDNSIMFFWVTLPKLMDSMYEIPNPLSIIHSWGFRPVTAAFVWIKLNKNARIDLPFDFNSEDWPWYHKDSFYSGLGRYTNSNVELCIICRRGKALERKAKNVKQLIFAPIREHSAKPREQYERIDALYPDVNKLELFARKQNPPPDHYDATGLDFDGIDIREWIKQYEEKDEIK
jgi:N6-adenosine-specific RNA methylase IME4